MDCESRSAVLTSPTVYADIGGSLVKVALVTLVPQAEVLRRLQFRLTKSAPTEALTGAFALTSL